MDFASSAFWTSLLQIIWIDLLLSGDNAVVIALAVRSLPEKQRKVGIWLGAAAAVGLRIIFAVVVSYLLNIPFLKVVGALLLFWIAIKLAKGEEEAHGEVAASDNLWKAVRTIAIADAVMSLDNVLAIAAAADGHFGLVIFGLLLSIPLVIAGSGLILWLIDRFPVVIWAGAALLGSLAGGMIAHEAYVARQIAHIPHAELIAQVVGAALVVVIGWMWDRRLDEERGAD